MIEKIFEQVMQAILRALSVAFVFAVCLNFVDVIGRYVFARTLAWGGEVQIYIMIAMAFLGAAVVNWRGAHLRMDILVKSVQAQGRHVGRKVAFVEIADDRLATEVAKELGYKIP